MSADPAAGPAAGPAADPVARSRVPLTALLVAHGTSTAGNAVTLVAVPLHVLQTTGSAVLTGVAASCAAVPVVVGGTLGGVLADRLGHRRTSVLADLASAAAVGAVPLLHWTTGLPLWALLVLVVVAGVLDAPGQASRYALLPDLARAAGAPVERATGLAASADRGSRMIGAPLGGLLVALLGGPGALAVDAVSFLASAAVVARWVPRAAPAAAAASGAGFLADLRGGAAAVLGDPLLRAVVLLLLATNVLDSAVLGVLLPVHATRVLEQPAALGLLLGAFSGGALAGSLAWSAAGHRLPRRAAFTGAYLVCGAPPVAALALGLPLPALLVVLALAGVAAGAINPVLDAVLLERTAPHARARVLGLVVALSWLGTPLGPLLAGAAVETAGLRTALVVAGAAYLLVTLTPLRGGPWRGLARGGG